MPCSKPVDQHLHSAERAVLHVHVAAASAEALQMLHDIVCTPLAYPCCDVESHPWGRQQVMTVPIHLPSDPAWLHHT
jgi:hypothetical protein